MTKSDSSASMRRAFRAAFPVTLPIFTGFLFLGAAYGILMNALGFHPLYAILMSAIVYAGSMQFVAAGLLTGPFDPLGALFMTLMVNARHLFYGLSMLEKYRGTGLKKIYLIHYLSDETFSINSTAEVPPGVDATWYRFAVTALDHAYWVLGTTVGAVAGKLVTFETKGIEFVLTALFLVIFLEGWRKEASHTASLVGLLAAALCLALFGAKHFLIPAMLMILAVLTCFRKPIERVEARR